MSKWKQAEYQVWSMWLEHKEHAYEAWREIRADLSLSDGEKERQCTETADRFNAEFLVAVMRKYRIMGVDSAIRLCTIALPSKPEPWTPPSYVVIFQALSDEALRIVDETLALLDRHPEASANGDVDQVWLG